MDDLELKKLLLETCPIRPGQEERAWAALRDRLYVNPPLSWTGFFLHTWRGRGLAAFGLALVVIAVNLGLLFSDRAPLATVDSQSAGIYATSFYSKPAGAQVVWLNGMEPATDSPTYLDPTTVIADQNETKAPEATGDPNSL